MLEGVMEISEADASTLEHISWLPRSQMVTVERTGTI